MAIQFNQLVKHGKLAFAPGPKYGFEDPDAERYFTKAGWAEEATGDPDIVIGQDSCSIDPDTVFADGPMKGLKILGGELDG